MPFTESLTVRILGDSSQLREELGRVTDELTDLSSLFRDLADVGSSFVNGLGNLSAATGALQQLEGSLLRVRQQVQALSGQSVTLNVSPALQSLQQLVKGAEAAAVTLRALSAVSSVRAPLPVAPSVPEALGVRRFATGGLVQGPSGVDQVPAKLSAGEFVINREATHQLGTGLLNQLNQRPQVLRQMVDPSLVPFSSGGFASRDVRPEIAAVPQVAFPVVRTPVGDVSARVTANGSGGPSRLQFTNHEPAPPQFSQQFTGVEVHVREAVDVERLVDDLQRRTQQQRNRWG